VEQELTTRIEFEKKQLETTRERLSSLKKTIKTEKNNITTRQEQKAELEQEIKDLEKALEKLRKKLGDSITIQEEASDKVERARDSARKMQKELDKALKQIAGWNDEIEKSSSDRHAIYRRCRLEEIDIPLVEGSLDKVPLVEVSPSYRGGADGQARKDDEMDIDDDGTQRAAVADDFGLEPDFEELDEEAKEVSRLRAVWGGTDVQDGSEEVGRELESEVTRMRTELEKLTPNTKAIEK